MIRYEPLPTLHLLSFAEQRNYEQLGYIKPSTDGVRTSVRVEEGKLMAIKGCRMRVILPNSIGLMYIYRDRYYDGANCTVYQAFCEYGALRIESFVENILIEVKDTSEKEGFIKTMSKYFNISLIGNEGFINISKNDMDAAVNKTPSLFEFTKPCAANLKKALEHISMFEKEPKPEPVIIEPEPINEIQRFAEENRIVFVERTQDVYIEPKPVKQFKEEAMYLEVIRRDDGLVVKRELLKKALKPSRMAELKKEWSVRHFVVRVRRTRDKLLNINSYENIN